MTNSWGMAQFQSFIESYGWDFALLIGKIMAIILPLMVTMAMLTYVERKVIAAMQLRKGPNRVGPFGLLQAFADGVKLLHKETIIPQTSNKYIFILAPIVTFGLSLIAWAVIPFNKGWVLSNLNVGVLYLFAVSSLSVYGILMAGWASNSKYALLGALRSVAQMVSYEVSIGLCLVSVVLCVGSLNLTAIVEAQKSLWFGLPMLPIMVIFFVSILAETNRAPFDLPEAEAELVSGYNVEYSAMTFALFFLGEYINMILMSTLVSLFFLGGWLPPLDCTLLQKIPGPLWFAFKISGVLFCFLWVRATFPRYRYDQLMRLGWKVFLPLSLVWVVGTAAFVLIRQSVDPFQENYYGIAHA